MSTCLQFSWLLQGHQVRFVPQHKMLARQISNHFNIVSQHLLQSSYAPVCKGPLPVSWQCGCAMDSATIAPKFSPPLAVCIPPKTVALVSVVCCVPPPHLVLVADILWTSRVAAAHGAIALYQQLTHGQVCIGCVTLEVDSTSSALQRQCLSAATDSVLHDLQEQVSLRHPVKH